MLHPGYADARACLFLGGMIVSDWTLLDVARTLQRCSPRMQNVPALSLTLPRARKLLQIHTPHSQLLSSHPQASMLMLRSGQRAKLASVRGHRLGCLT